MEHLIISAIVILQWLIEYNAALACIGFMAFLGFVDDVLDVPWRV
jgi:UDP-N-acetylglucosamine--dolichyl-phosphate N-acetylglucosaminephosphotransferase